MAFLSAYAPKNDMPVWAVCRAAQLELFRQKRWASPYYWAGFVAGVEISNPWE